MDTLTLSHLGKVLQRFSVGSSMLAAGSGATCEIALPDGEVQHTEYLFQRLHGTIIKYRVTASGTILRPEPLPYDEPLHIGKHYCLVRTLCHDERVSAASMTMDLGVTASFEPRFWLLISTPASTRRVGIEHTPLTIGSSETNDITVHDRSVSRHHCRLEPARGDIVIRDLGSRNGTWVNGTRMNMGRLQKGSFFKLGRTDFRIASQRTMYEPGDMIAESPAMLAVLANVERYALLPWPVLIHGESGAGKEHLARALHERGPRRKGPFVAINAGGLPRHIIESELFGHERGAFTGAGATHKGVFEQAHGGTLFLDEIGELQTDLQARLLRVLDTGEIRRVGGETPTRIDVRVVCATHRDLRRMVSENEFRSDLYFRLTRMMLIVPPLRERSEDICALAEAFTAAVSEEIGPRKLHEDAMARLLAHAWTGNVRELRNVISVAAVLTADVTIRAEDIARAMNQVSFDEVDHSQNLEKVIRHYRGNISAAARSLGIPRSTLRDRIQSYRRTLNTKDD